MLKSKIKECRELKGLSQTEVAEKLNITRQAYNHYETGKREPNLEVISRLSELLGVSSDYLLGIVDTPDPQIKTTPTSDISGIHGNVLRIPVYGTIPAGLPLEAIEDILDVEEAPASWAKGGQEFFALKIKGDSMSPKYLDKDVIIFRRTPVCENGQDCCVMINGFEATFKKVFINEIGITLQPLNPDYQPAFFSNKDVEELPVTIIGVVKELRRTLY